MIRGIEHKGEPLHCLFDGLTERLVQKFGTPFDETEAIAFYVGKRRVPKVRANLSTGTLLPILDVTVTIVSDTEIETIDLGFGVELGEGYRPPFVLLTSEGSRRTQRQTEPNRPTQYHTETNAEPNRA